MTEARAGMVAVPIAKLRYAERFLTAADRLAEAGDGFRGQGRVVYEGDCFRVEYDVRCEDHPSVREELRAWTVGRDGWGFTAWPARLHGQDRDVEVWRAVLRWAELPR